MIDTAKLSDESVVELVRTKDKELFAEVIKRYQKKLLRYARSIIGDDQIAADVVQESFIKAYVNLNGFDTKKKFSSWMYRIVHNQAMNIVSKDKRLQPIHDQLINERDVSVEDEFILKELNKQTNNCLEKMSLIYKVPLSLFYLEEKSYEEISDIVRIPIGTVGTRINRATAIMKKLCQKNQM